METPSTDISGPRRRRDVLRAIGATATAGALAGCGEGVTRSFAASEVSLSTPTRQRTGFDDETRDGIADGSTRTENGTEVGVAVVSQVVTYRRSGRGPGDAAGLGVVTTPDASVSGQPVSPHASVSLADVADGADLPQVLQSAGLGDSLSWPEQPAKVDTTTARLLGSSVTVESWVGVADDGDRHLVTAHLARGATGDDVVVAGAVTTDRLPDGGGSIRPNAVADGEPFRESLADARRLFGGLVAGTAPGTATPTPPEPGPARIFNRNVPEEAHQQVHDMEDEGIRCFAFTPDGGWVVITHRNNRWARGIPDECYEKLKELKSNGREIRWVAFPPKGGNSWSVVFDGGFFNRNVPDELHRKMLDYTNRGHQIELVAFPPAGGNSWFLLTDRTTFSRNVPDECYQLIRNVHQGPRRVHHVAFEPGGGWVVFADDYYFARNVDDELFSMMQDYAADDDRVDLVAFDGGDGTGWSIISNGPVRGGWYDPIREVERSVNGTSIWQAMRNANVPGVAVAVVEDDELAWATGYGHAKAGSTDRAVHPETVFQAASISKTLAAIGAVRMARDGTLNLGQDVNRIVDGWALENQIGVTTSNDVTVRRLLSHSGGTNVPGFGGYRSWRAGSVPSVTEVLDGDGNSDPVRVVYDPGTSASYSGGGYTVVQKCMADASGQSFADWMQTNVLDPVGMADSTFEQPLPIPWFDGRSVATGHDDDGDPIPGGRNVYPESAAAGLYSTVLDLARVIRMLNGGGTIDGTQVLTSGEVQSLLTVQTLTNGNVVNASGVRGLGFVLRNRVNGPLAYQHGGTNAGFRSAYRGYPSLGTGVAVMTNGDDPSLRWDVVNAVVETYGWE